MTATLHVPRPATPAIAGYLGGAKSWIVRLREALADLDEKWAGESRSRSRSRAPSFRGGAKPISAVLGRK